jgi:hypothetical protein
MTVSSALSRAQIKFIYEHQKALNLGEARLAHVKKVAGNFMLFKSGKLEKIFNAMLPHNRCFEDRAEYLGLLSELHRLFSGTKEGGRAPFEAGLRLHDIGYAIGNAGDHPEKGYEILSREDGKKIFDKINISDPAQRAFVSTMVRYHGLLTDIGFLYPIEILKSFSFEEKVLLAVASGMDATAKPYEKGFHSMLFSRLLKRYFRFLNESTPLSPEEKLQQLFGPINYAWLKNEDAATLSQAVALRRSRAHDEVMQNVYFHCWSLLKDLITPTVQFAATFYTPFSAHNASDFAKFLFVIGRTIELSGLAPRYTVDTSIKYLGLKSEEKQPIIDRIRGDLRSDIQDVEQIDERTFAYGGLRLYVEKSVGSHKITLSWGGFGE